MGAGAAVDPGSAGRVPMAENGEKVERVPVLLQGPLCGGVVGVEAVVVEGVLAVHAVGVLGRPCGADAAAAGLKAP